MKKLAVLLFVAVLGSSQVFASDNNPNKNQVEKLRNTIAVLLEAPQIEVKTELKADIQFTLNSKREIVVLNVESKNYIVEDFVKSRLNYKKVDSDVSPTGNRVFNITLKIQKPQGA